MKKHLVNGTLALALLAGGVVTLGNVRAHAAAPVASTVTSSTTATTSTDKEVSGAADTDNVNQQVGDQTTPDVPGAVEKEAAGTEVAGKDAGPDVQEQVGDQSTPDVPGAAETPDSAGK